MKRVLIAHPYRHVGGPDTFVANIVRALGGRGWQFWILTPVSRPLTDALRALGADVVIEPRLATLPRTIAPARLAAHVREMGQVGRTVRGLIDAHDIGVVHGVHETMWGLLRSVRQTLAGRVASVHGLRFTSPRWAGRANTRLLAEAADRIICVSNVVRTVFLEWGVPVGKLALVPSSVDLGRFRPDVSGADVRRELGIPPDAPLIGTVGSVDERKGQAYFLDACPTLAAKHPALRFVIVGHTDGGSPAHAEYLAQLRAKASRLGLDDRLQFVPARADMPQVMAALDVLVQPSLTEAGPRAPLEAMATGRPVVGTRVEGLAEEVIDGETGVLVPPADSAALGAAIDDLLRDRDRRHRLGLAGRARVERFYSLDATADLIEHTYEAAAADARAAR